MKGTIHIGTSGWSYKHWKEIYYPKGLASAKWLAFYAQTFQTTEINTSFYQLPREETVLKWVNTVPEDFQFCPKMSRFITHMKKLKEPEEPLERYFSIFKPMKNKMGPVLIQLPPQLRYSLERTEPFYKLLKKTYKPYSFVVEVRHESWLAKESLDLMTHYGIGFVISHSENAFPYYEVITAKHVYVRFHGPKQLYASSYPDQLLKLYANKFTDWAGKGHEVWVFFNNDIYGYAISNAKRLMEIIKKGQ